jgi:hypothetical protein
MREVGYGRDGPLVVRRGFVRSRYETEFVAAAYELVAPIRAKELSVVTASAGELDSGSRKVEMSVRRPA